MYLQIVKVKRNNCFFCAITNTINTEVTMWVGINVRNSYAIINQNGQSGDLTNFPFYLKL